MKTRLPVRKAILRRKTYEAPAEGRLNKMRLDFNENTSGCGPAVLRALRKLTPQQLAMYPEYGKPTRHIAAYFGVSEHELLLTNGGDDALRVFFDAFVEPRNHILICEPTFPMYRYYAEIAGARVETLRYGAEMEFPLDDFVSALRKKPAVIFIANPNNPTGTLLPRAAIKRVLLAASNTVVVIDEAYAEFSGVTVLPWIRKYPNLFVTRTFSKAAGLAGLRLGAAMACRESIALLRRAMPPFPVNVGALVAAEAALQERSSIQSYVKQMREIRQWFAGELARLGVRIFPSAGNFLLADFGSRGPALFKKLATQGILVRERSKDIGPGFVRISIGTGPEMKQLVKMIQRELGSNQKANQKATRPTSQRGRN
jgi:histidinol-phosphate aminotransferase